MTATTGLVVTGIGAVTPVGLSAAASYAALRAGVSGMGEIETLRVDSETMDKVPAIGGRVPTEWYSGGPVEWEWPGHERFAAQAPPAPEKIVAKGSARLLEIAVPAALEAWSSAVASGTSITSAGLYLGLDYADQGDAIVSAISSALGISFRGLGGASAGRAAALLALEAAANALLSGEIQIALVGGIDSQIRGELLERLESKEMLKTGANPQGIIPGEAAAFLTLERADLARQRRARPLGWLMSVASAKEPTFGTEEPNRAEGLTEVLRVARYEGGFEVPPLVICDLNGNRYRAIEWGMSSLRTLGDLHGESQLWHPADCIGDTGAASGVLNIGWGVTAMNRGYARAERILVWGASDGRSRASAVLAPYVS